MNSEFQLRNSYLFGIYAIIVLAFVWVCQPRRTTGTPTTIDTVMKAGKPVPCILQRDSRYLLC